MSTFWPDGERECAYRPQPVGNCSRWTHFHRCPILSLRVSGKPDTVTVGLLSQIENGSSIMPCVATSRIDILRQALGLAALIYLIFRFLSNAVEKAINKRLGK